MHVWDSVASNQIVERVDRTSVRSFRGSISTGDGSAEGDEGNGQRQGPMVRTDGGDRRCKGSTAPGSSWLEGQEDTQREEGPSGGGSRQVWPMAMTDGEG